MHYFGKYKSYVRDNDDPTGRGRLRLYCPQVMGMSDNPDQWLPWAHPMFPWMGGLSTIDFGVPPTPGQTDSGVDEYIVWVEFEAGDPSYPIWVGVTPIAPTLAAETVRMKPEDAAGRHGGTLIDDPPSGALTDPLNEPAPLVPERETRILAKKGRDIIIGSKDSGYLLLGPS